MSNPNELPQMVTELATLSREYVKQEAVAPIKPYMKVLGRGLAAAVFFTIGLLLLTIAGLRMVVDLFPDTTMLSALGYGATALGALLLAGLLGWRLSKAVE